MMDSILSLCATAIATLLCNHLVIGREVGAAKAERCGRSLNTNGADG